jgi:hypothetical protein
MDDTEETKQNSTTRSAEMQNVFLRKKGENISSGNPTVTDTNR